MGQRLKSLFGKQNKKGKEKEKKKEKGTEKKEEEKEEENLKDLNLWGYDPRYIEFNKWEYELLCLICERICRDAVKIECKGEGISARSFCQKCVLEYFERHRKSKGRCPIKSHGIHKKKPGIRPNSRLRERISWLKAGCPNDGR